LLLSFAVQVIVAVPAASAFTTGTEQATLIQSKIARHLFNVFLPLPLTFPEKIKKSQPLTDSF
jgi:hypothetical protein